MWDEKPTTDQAAMDARAADMTSGRNGHRNDHGGTPSPADAVAAAAERAERIRNNVVPQQTRHARRLYVGNIPEGLVDHDVHDFFRDAIEKTASEPPQEDPILTVYVNRDRRFCFVEFRTVELTTACLAFDGINLYGKGKVRVKRPNDYNPTLVPPSGPLPELDVSKLGIVSGSVPDSPNKIFIGGLHYHLSEQQVMDLLGAFGTLKAFHLVKHDADLGTSKGYCFCEYADPNVTMVAIKGLDGMDLGGGKTLTARVADPKDSSPNKSTSYGGMNQPPMPIPNNASGYIPSGMPPNLLNMTTYNVEELVDAAMGLRQMPVAAVLQGGPVTPLVPGPTTHVHNGNNNGGVAPPPPPPPRTIPPPPPPPPPQTAPGAPPSNVFDIANAALAAAYPSQTRVLVLSNMVVPEDLETPENHQDLSEEVREECAKFGNLLSMKIPREVVRHQYATLVSV